MDGQRFCLTLVGEERLWYGSHIPIVVDWNGLQDQFRQQYSKIFKTREQLFHVWRSFHYDKNTETLDTYVTHITQVVALLGHGKSQILKVFKNTLPNRLYWVLSPINDLIIVLEMAKRILAKEQIDRQLVGHLTTMLFMKVSDGYHNKKAVTFDMQGRLDDKIDKLISLVRKLTAQCDK